VAQEALEVMVVRMVAEPAVGEEAAQVVRLRIIQHTLRDTQTIQLLITEVFLILEEVVAQELLLVLLVLVRTLQGMVQE
jgi:hypothetical protein